MFKTLIVKFKNFTTIKKHWKTTTHSRVFSRFLARFSTHNNWWTVRESVLSRFINTNSDRGSWVLFGKSCQANLIGKGSNSSPRYPSSNIMNSVLTRCWSHTSRRSCPLSFQILDFLDCQSSFFEIVSSSQEYFWRKEKKILVRCTCWEESAKNSKI